MNPIINGVIEALEAREKKEISVMLVHAGDGYDDTHVMFSFTHPPNLPKEEVEKELDNT